MSKLILRTAICGILLVSLAALPAISQVIPAGKDFWVTPANGQTYFTFPAGDVESLCGAPKSDLWDHRVALSGVPVAGSDYDTVVGRIDNAVFDATGIAKTRVQVSHLAFRGSSLRTPCGSINWSVGLAGPQRVTDMVIRRTSDKGGIFNAQLAVDVEFRGFNAGSGAYVGSLFYAFDLPDPGAGTGAGTPWSFGPNGEFRAGMTELDNCIDVLRKKLNLYSPDSSHFYYISDMIAAGKCREQK
jgi:hypothetical protein